MQKVKNLTIVKTLNIGRIKRLLVFKEIETRYIEQQQQQNTQLPELNLRIQMNFLQEIHNIRFRDIIKKLKK